MVSYSADFRETSTALDACPSARCRFWLID
jgi:hypothetical protein